MTSCAEAAPGTRCVLPVEDGNPPITMTCSKQPQGALVCDAQ
jgi:hypothetical protein